MLFLFMFSWFDLEYVVVFEVLNENMEIDSREGFIKDEIWVL